jgi:hypothetical protein
MSAVQADQDLLDDLDGSLFEFSMARNATDNFPEPNTLFLLTVFKTPSTTHA